ncbi:MAG: hypothetical protein IPJ08_00005 [Burkholderiales bacterium]|nr:hypothetical protein [Burkholderiales bacterium]
MRSTGREDDLLAEEARRIFRAEMERRGYTFKQLAERLAENTDGEAEEVQALINKVSRGRFTFAFFIRAMRAMGVTVVGISPVDLA